MKIPVEDGSTLGPASGDAGKHRGRALQRGALHVVIEAADAAQFLAAAGPARTTMDHLRQRGPVTCLLLGAVAVDEDHASMEAPDAEGELGGGRGVVRVNGGDETAAAAMGDAPALAAILDRIASKETLLRYWALGIFGQSGRSVMRGRAYPWARIIDTPAVQAARHHLDAAYDRERAVAQQKLAGLLDR